MASPAPPKATRRVIYLDGVDTGLSAFTQGEAVTTLLTVLHKRGRFGITRRQLELAYSTSRGRVDFNLRGRQD